MDAILEREFKRTSKFGTKLLDNHQTGIRFSLESLRRGRNSAFQNIHTEYSDYEISAHSQEEFRPFSTSAKQSALSELFVDTSSTAPMLQSQSFKNAQNQSFTSKQDSNPSHMSNFKEKSKALGTDYKSTEYSTEKDK